MATPVSPVAKPKLPKAGFWVALVIFLVAAVVGTIMIVLSIVGIRNAIIDFAEIDVPRTSEVRLGTGDYWVFASIPATSSSNAGAVRVFVTAPDGSAAEVSADFNKYNESSDGQQFTALGKINSTEAGVYTMETDGPSDATVRIGKLPIGRTIGLFVGGIAVGTVGFLVALILLIVTLVRRSKAKKRLVAAGALGGALPAPYPPAPPAPPAPAPAPPAPAPAPAPPAPAPAPAPPAPAPAPPAPSGAPTPPPAGPGPAPTPPPAPGAVAPPPPPGEAPGPPEA